MKSTAALGFAVFLVSGAALAAPVGPLDGDGVFGGTAATTTGEGGGEGGEGGGDGGDGGGSIPSLGLDLTIQLWDDGSLEERATIADRLLGEVGIYEVTGEVVAITPFELGELADLIFNPIGGPSVGSVELGFSLEPSYTSDPFWLPGLRAGIEVPIDYILEEDADEEPYPYLEAYFKLLDTDRFRLDIGGEFRYYIDDRDAGETFGGFLRTEIRISGVTDTPGCPGLCFQEMEYDLRNEVVSPVPSTFDLTPVPLPPAGIVLAGGLAALAVARRGRTRGDKV